MQYEDKENVYQELMIIIPRDIFRRDITTENPIYNRCQKSQQWRDDVSVHPTPNLTKESIEVLLTEFGEGRRSISLMDNCND